MNQIRLILLAIVTLFLMSCSGSAKWVSQTEATSVRQIDSLLILGRDADGDRGRHFESEFKQAIPKNVETFTSGTLSSEVTRDNVVEFVGSKGIGFVLVTQVVDINEYEAPETGKGDYTTYIAGGQTITVENQKVDHVDVTLETRLFDTSTQSLVWSGVMELKDPTDREAAVQEVIKKTIERMQELGFLAAQN